MKKYLLLFATIVLAMGSSVAYASTISNTPNLFETYLANSEGSTDTSMVLASGVLRDGSSLSGFTCFTVDSNTPTVEYECGNVSGTNVTGLTRGIDAVSGTTTISSLAYAHHRGADVKVTDYPTLTILSRIFQAIDGVALPFHYDSGVATSSIAANRSNIVDWGLLQDTALNGSGAIAATTGAKGYVQIATPAQAAASTLFGSTGASLSLTSGISTSTYNAATAASNIVVTGTTGSIDPNFLPIVATTSTVANIPIINIGRNQQVFTSNGTFTVPTGVTKVGVQICGGGGGSGGVQNAGPTAGGGAGGYSEGNVNVAASTSIEVDIGAAGTAGTATPTGGGTGGTTRFSTFMSATGGTGSNGVGGQGAVGGTASGGQLNSSGQQGANSVNISTSYIPGIGASGPFGITYCSGGNGVAVASGGTVGLVGTAGVTIVSW